MFRMRLAFAVGCYYVCDDGSADNIHVLIEFQFEHINPLNHSRCRAFAMVEYHICVSTVHFDTPTFVCREKIPQHINTYFMRNSNEIRARTAHGNRVRGGGGGSTCAHVARTANILELYSAHFAYKLCAYNLAHTHFHIARSHAHARPGRPHKQPPPPKHRARIGASPQTHHNTRCTHTTLYAACNRMRRRNVYQRRAKFINANSSVRHDFCILVDNIRRCICSCQYHTETK